MAEDGRQGRGSFVDVDFPILGVQVCVCVCVWFVEWKGPCGGVGRNSLRYILRESPFRRVKWAFNRVLIAQSSRYSADDASDY